MDYITFDMAESLHCNINGRFETEDTQWIHSSRTLLDYELVIVTSGTLYIGDEDGEYTVPAGSYRLLFPTACQRGTRPGRCQFYWLHFYYQKGARGLVSKNPPSDAAFTKAPSPGADFGISTPLSHALAPKITFPVAGVLPSPDRLIILLKQLADCTKKYQDSLLNDHYTSVILCELADQMKYAGQSHGSLHGYQFYHDILDYIHWHERERLKVEDVAAHFGYNAKYLTAFFRRFAGVSLKQYILERKISLAKGLLSDSNLPIAQIGYSLGFVDNHHFSHTFKLLTGLTPTEFRNSFDDRIQSHR